MPETPTPAGGPTLDLGHACELQVDRIAAFNALFDDLVDALADGKGRRVVAVIGRIEDQFGSDISAIVIDGLLAAGFATRRAG